KDENRLRAGRPDRHPTGGCPGLLPRDHNEFFPHDVRRLSRLCPRTPGQGPLRQRRRRQLSAANTEILAKRAGLDLVHIPFKGGGAEILRDLANGDIHVSWFNITNPVGMMKAGRVRALAIAAEQRLSQHADVPTLAEVGFPGMRAAQWVA